MRVLMWLFDVLFGRRSERLYGGAYNGAAPPGPVGEADWDRLTSYDPGGLVDPSKYNSEGARARAQRAVDKARHDSFGNLKEEHWKPQRDRDAAELDLRSRYMGPNDRAGYGGYERYQDFEKNESTVGHIVDFLLQFPRSSEVKVDPRMSGKVYCIWVHVPEADRS